MALSVGAEFDDVVRVSRIFMSEPCEPEFLRFLHKTEELNNKLLDARQECDRAIKAGQESNRVVSDLERKLNRARQLLDVERRERKVAESRLEDLENQMARVRELLWDESRNCKNKIQDDAWQRLASVCSQSETATRRSNRRSSFRPTLSAVMDLDETDHTSCSHFQDLTGSLLSDIGYSQSDDELKVMKTRRTSGTDGGPSTKRRRSGCLNHSCSQSNDVQIVTVETQDSLSATTTMTVTRDVPITTMAMVEPHHSVDNKDSRVHFPKTLSLPSSTPRHLIDTQPSAGTPCPPSGISYSAGALSPPLGTFAHKASFSESDESLLVAQESRCPSPQPFNCGLNLMARNRLNGKTHTFTQKAIIKIDHCYPCGKRIKFGKIAAKCNDCHALVHVECKERLPLPCIPVSGIPTNRGAMGIISDFTPPQPPFIPALLVLCINEVEARGLNEVGIYRISGSERDIKALKERFLKQKGTPDLSQIDIYVICGCIKDFLRSLREPLVLPSMRSEFIRCVEPSEEHDQQARLYQVVADLPRPNRDSLAYLILHLQRVSDSPACKMPAGNLAKVFGPTLVGYSSANPVPETMMQENIKQVAVMQLMMKAPSSYWSCFVNSVAESTHQKPQ